MFEEIYQKETTIRARMYRLAYVCENEERSVTLCTPISNGVTINTA